MMINHHLSQFWQLFITKVDIIITDLNVTAAIVKKTHFDGLFLYFQSECLHNTFQQ